MRKIREVLRLRWSCGLQERATARACRVARSSVSLYVKRAHGADLWTWEQVERLDDMELEHRLFPPPERRESERPLPQWGTVHTEMQRPGVTRYLLWQEYKEQDWI